MGVGDGGKEMLKKKWWWVHKGKTGRGRGGKRSGRKGKNKRQKEN